MRKALALGLSLGMGFLFAFAGSNGNVVSAQKGKSGGTTAVYQNQCAKCHGADGKGIASLPDIPNFTDSAWQSSRSNKQISDAIANGVGIMPGYKGTLSAAEVQSLVKHVRAFAPPKAKK